MSHLQSKSRAYQGRCSGEWAPRLRRTVANFHAGVVACRPRLAKLPVVIAFVVALGAVSAKAEPVVTTPLAAVADEDANTQITELYQLQAAFHRAASVHTPNGLDSQDILDQRIADMLSLWTDDGSLTLMTVSPGRLFVGKGEPGTPSCAPGANTLCDFFTNVAGSFRPDNRLVSLAPAYATHFEPHGNTATVYFECHYFDANTWQDKTHIAFDGTAEKVDGHWLFSHADAPGIAVPYP